MPDSFQQFFEDLFYGTRELTMGTHCGSSDVFSYPEDDSVVDPLLAQHLAFFGIDFSALQKVSYLY